MRKHTLRLLAVSATYFALGSAFAADTVTATISNGTTATGSATAIPASRTASRFESLAGSPENAANLVAGLRSGGAITLVMRDSVSGVRFIPATTTMGYGNITRALSLAQRQLAAQGIAEPTPDQLHVALNGGTLISVDSSGAVRTVEMAGVLLLRSQGMGWGQIAHRLAVRPGNRPATTQGNIDRRGSSHRQAAVVSGDGSLMYGRVPGYSSTVQARTQAQTHGTSRINASANVQAGRPSSVTGGSSMSTGSHGTNVVQVSGKGRL